MFLLFSSYVSIIVPVVVCLSVSGYRLGLGREGRQCCCGLPPPPPPPPEDRETGRARIFGGSVQVMFAWGHRDSFDGTQIVGPLWDQITFFTLL